MKIYNAHHMLKDNQYYHTEHKKLRICLHHTSGSSAKSSINWWNQKPDHVSTPYVIDRKGNILEVFPPEFWAYALGINSSIAEKITIHIEIANWGWLNKIRGNFYSYRGKRINKRNVVTYKRNHRGHRYYERYTPEQVSAVVYLIHYLNKRFDLDIIGSDIEKFWHYDFDSQKKLISHTTLRKDKSDIHPQPDLINAIYTYAQCNAPITE